MSGHALDAPRAQVPEGASDALGQSRRSDVAVGLGLLVLLGLVVAARWAAVRDGVADPIVIGGGFGLALVAVAVVGRYARPRGLPGQAPAIGRDIGQAVLIGLVGGGALIGLALAGRTIAGVPGLLPPLRGDLFAPWAAATILVAAGEEAVLRGVVFDRLIRGAGIWPAILVTSLAFALMHVPFYGWRVVPLDLGVGIWFAGLRLWSGGIVAPSISHALADLATWWL